MNILKDELANNEEIKSLSNQLNSLGLPANSIVSEAIDKIPGNPTKAIALRMLYDLLIQRISEHKAKQKPKSLIGKIIKFIFY